MAVTGLASGAVITGFGYPYVAKYTVSSGTVSYTSGQVLARGVSVSTSIETLGEDNIFYANNAAAEVAPLRFKRGTATLTVDGLLVAAEKLILGLPNARSLTVQSGVTVEMEDYGDDQNIPYVGIGYVIRRQSAGVEYFQGVVYLKARFSQFEPGAETQGEDIDWQTTELEATLLRDDTSKHNWKTVTAPCETALEAYNAVVVTLGGTAAAALPTNGAVTST